MRLLLLLLSLTLDRCDSSETCGTIAKKNEQVWSTIPEGFVVSINSTICNFHRTPRYFVTVVAERRTIGSNCIMNASRKAFQVFIFATKMHGNHPNRHLQISWIGTESSTSGVQRRGWKKHDAQTLFIDVDTASAGFNQTPTWLASLNLGWCITHTDSISLKHILYTSLGSHHPDLPVPTLFQIQSAPDSGSTSKHLPFSSLLQLLQMQKDGP
jgi:hypothetical protein